MYGAGETSHRRDTEDTERAQSRIWFPLRNLRILCVSAVNLIAFPYTHLKFDLNLKQKIKARNARGPFITVVLNCRASEPQAIFAQIIRPNFRDHLTTFIVIVCCPLIMNCEGGSVLSDSVATESGV